MKKIILSFLILFSSTIFATVPNNPLVKTITVAHIQKNLSQTKDDISFIAENSLIINTYLNGLETAGVTLNTVPVSQNNYKVKESFYSIPSSECFQDNKVNPQSNNIVTAICILYTNAKQDIEDSASGKKLFVTNFPNSMESDWIIIKGDETQSISSLKNTKTVFRKNDGEESFELVARYKNLKTEKTLFRKVVVTADNCRNKSGIFTIISLDNSYEEFDFNTPALFKNGVEMICNEYLSVR